MAYTKIKRGLSCLILSALCAAPLPATAVDDLSRDLLHVIKSDTQSGAQGQASGTNAQNPETQEHHPVTHKKPKPHHHVEGLKELILPPMPPHEPAPPQPASPPPPAQATQPTAEQPSLLLQITGQSQPPSPAQLQPLNIQPLLVITTPEQPATPGQHTVTIPSPGDGHIARAAPTTSVETTELPKLEPQAGTAPATAPVAPATAASSSPAPAVATTPAATADPKSAGDAITPPPAIMAEWLVVVIAACILFVVIQQSSMFQRQLGIMRGSLTETDIAVKTALETADAAKDVANATKDSITNMKETTQRQLRAYVNVTNTKVVQKIEKDRAFEASIGIRNGGQTPAYEVKLYTQISTEDFPLKKGSDLDKLPPTSIKSVIAPNMEFNFIARLKVLDEKPLAEFMAGKTALYIQGMLKYRDAFGQHHIAEFRYAHAHRIGMYDEALFVCDKGNEAD